MSALLLGRRRLWTTVAAQLRVVHHAECDTFVGQPGRFICTSASQLDDNKASKGKELVDPSASTNVKDLICLAMDRPFIPDGMPKFHRTADQALLERLKEMEGLGGVMQLGIFMRKSPAVDAPSVGDPATDADSPDAEAALQKPVHPDELADVGTMAVVKSITWTSGGSTLQGQLALQGVRRVRRFGVVSQSPLLQLRCKPLKNQDYNIEDPQVKATHLELVQTIKEIFKLSPLYMEQLRFVRYADFNDYSRFSDMLVSLASGSRDDLQEYLELTDIPKKMLKALEILKKEVDIIQMQADISKRVEEKFTKDQRRYFLMEQLKHIQKELGLTKDEKSALTQKFTERFAPHKDAAPEEARLVIEEELNKLRTLEPASAEFNVTRNYLDWLTSLPWGVMDEEKYDITHAQQTLDADHHGLQDVKDRILEFIAVGQLNGTVQGKILCLVGPPGVGKTSIGKSIANSLGRKFFRFSVGGLSDVAEIKGHRRTYVGAMPGKIVQCLKQVKSSNPLVLIDELDKLGRGIQGDPASALLELLDPEQNSAFRDHYLDVPVDLSKVLFVCTANVTDTIPPPLLDRMEVIHISGYTADEKRAIARKYLEPQARSAAAMPENATQITDPALDVLIEQYCRESGVRNLKKQLEKIYRKLALQLVSSEKLQFVDVEREAPAENAAAEAGAGAGMPEGGSQPSPSDTVDLLQDDLGTSVPAAPVKRKQQPVYSGDPIIVGEDNMGKYVGNPPFNSDRFYDTTPAGVVMGLAWTSMGGSTLYIESNKMLSSGDAGLKLTGQLGDVMKESAQIAQTFARAFLHTLQPDSDFLEKGTVHVHVPQGATPKDGPSAGCTMVTALLSLALGTPVASDLAMTGEISLSGRMLPIGGVKEKTLAAKRSGVKTVIFPDSNKRDWLELSEELRAGMEPHFLSHYLDVFKIAFPSIAEQHHAAMDALESQRP